MWIRFYGLGLSDVIMCSALNTRFKGSNLQLLRVNELTFAAAADVLARPVHAAISHAGTADS
jgi:hypothetical protein